VSTPFCGYSLEHGLHFHPTVSTVDSQVTTMALPEKRRKHHLLLLSILWLSQSESFQSPTIGTIHSRKARDVLSRRTAVDDDTRPVTLVGRKTFSQSMDVTSSTNSPDTREIEQQIVKLGRSGKTDEALALYRQVLRPTVRLMNAAIDACSRAKPTRIEEAFDIFEKSVEKYGLKPNVFTFGVLMNTCNRSRNGTKALALLKTMKVGVCRRRFVVKFRHWKSCSQLRRLADALLVGNR